MIYRSALLFSRRVVAVAALFSLGAASLPAAANFSGLHVFGDSLSDNGNLNALTGYPPSPYFFGRFSNGPVAAEYLAAGLGLGAATFFDHAFGGATTGVDGQFPGTGLQSQVGGFVTALGANSADSHALYMVWAGANDFLHAPPGQPIQDTIGNAITNLATAVSTLHAKGATQFVLPLLPDLGATPRALAYDAVQPGTAAGLTYVSTLFNTELRGVYGSLAANWNDEHIYVFDTFVAQHDTMAAAASAGKNVTEACYIEGVKPLCAGYGLNHYYFDDIHPSTATHQALAAGMLAAVPEPQTWALMVGGLAVVGALARRRSS